MSTDQHRQRPLRVGVIGGAGYAGGELCRFMLNHPHVGTIVPTSRKREPFESVHPNLAGCGLEFATFEELFKGLDALDVVFFSTPAGEAMTEARDFLDRDVRVIDLSTDFRFRDPATYERVYGKQHASPDLLSEAACGITELYRDEVRRARLVANPGCYVITAVLGLVPLLKSGLTDTGVAVHLHAINGTTGAGSTPRTETMHAEVFGSLLPYSMEGHRHGPELENRLSELTGREAQIHLSTAHGDFARGLYVHATVPLNRRRGPAFGRPELLQLYLDAYGPGLEKEPFVLVNDRPKDEALNEKNHGIYPSPAHVLGSNFCHLGIDWDPARGTAKAMAVTDNLVKGAAGAALQNMNVMLGLDETSGLRHFGL